MHVARKTWGVAAKGWIMRQVLKAVTYLHRVAVIHSDIKCSNVTCHEDAEMHVHVLDFGKSWVDMPGCRPMFSTPSHFKVGTLHCRAPEIILCDPRLGPPIDVWAVGALMGELTVTGKPLFPPRSKHAMDVLDQVLSLLGTPTAVEAGSLADLPAWKDIDNFGYYDRANFDDKFKGEFGPRGIDLLVALLTLDPQRRAVGLGFSGCSRCVLPLKHSRHTIDSMVGKVTLILHMLRGPMYFNIISFISSVGSLFKCYRRQLSVAKRSQG
jgi:serine/threonine protein kinase